MLTKIYTCHQKTRNLVNKRYIYLNNLLYEVFSQAILITMKVGKAIQVLPSISKLQRRLSTLLMQKQRGTKKKKITIGRLDTIMFTITPQSFKLWT